MSSFSTRRFTRGVTGYTSSVRVSGHFALEIKESGQKSERIADQMGKLISLQKGSTKQTSPSLISLLGWDENGDLKID
jgi:hypothetical protein